MLDVWNYCLVRRETGYRRRSRRDWVDAVRKGDNLILLGDRELSQGSPGQGRCSSRAEYELAALQCRVSGSFDHIASEIEAGSSWFANRQAVDEWDFGWLVIYRIECTSNDLYEILVGFWSWYGGGSIKTEIVV